MYLSPVVSDTVEGMRGKSPDVQTRRTHRTTERAWTPLTVVRSTYGRESPRTGVTVRLGHVEQTQPSQRA